MNEAILPLLVEADELESRLTQDGLLVVDLGKPETYRQAHLPGAVHLDYARIVEVRKPAMGLLPEPGVLGKVLGQLGLRPETHVVAYDDEGGGRAARLLWTLATVGHRRFSLLNGGLLAWANEGHILDNGVTEPRPGADYPVTSERTETADAEYILSHLDDPGVALLDARSTEEFRGLKRFADRGGHIPGAVNLDWLQTMDQDRNLRFRPESWLRQRLDALGVTPDKEIIVYCQSHHRSAHSYIMLKTLGYERVRGYPGSWSDWGNRSDTPVET